MLQRIKVVKGNLRTFTAFHHLSRFLQFLSLYGRGIPHSLPPLEEAFHIPSPFGGGRERERPLHRDMQDYVPTLS